MGEAVIAAPGMRLFDLLGQGHWLAMFCGYAITNPHHFIKGGLVNEVRPANPNVLKRIEGAAATPIFQGIPMMVDHGLALFVCKAKDQVNAGVNAMDL
jgi:hypothetical protein